MIEHQVVESVLAAANARIVDVVSDYVVLKKRGSNYFGCCPFHNEKTGSFSVNPARGIYKCFGCGKAGNAASFVMEVDHLTFPEAIQYLGRKVGITVEDKVLSPEEQQRQSVRESLMAVNNFAREHFIDNLWNTDEGQAIALPYFRERGFRDDTIKKFDLGYSLAGRTKFCEQALLKGFKPEYLQKTSLVIFGENNYRADRFSGRVMFPIHNLAGKVIAFGGRVMKKTDDVAKYVNSAESDVYHKSDVVYGLFHARKAIVKQDTCYLVEGYTDVISMHQAGLENVVASCGTSLTTDQIRLIGRYTKNVTVLYDGDSAGIKAAMRGIDMLLVEGMNVRVLLLPDGEDPDSFARSHSADEYREFIEQNQTDFIHFKAKLLMAEAANDSTKRASLVNDIMESVSKVQDKVLREIYLKDCSKMMDISVDTLMGVLSDTARKQAVENRKRYEAEVNQRKYIEARTRAEASVQDLELPPPSEAELMQMQMQMGIKPSPQTLAPVRIKSQNPFEYEERELMRLMVKYCDVVINRETGVTVPMYILSAIEAEHDNYTPQSVVFQKMIDCLRAVPDLAKIDPQYFINQADSDISSAAADLLTCDTSESKFHKRYRMVVDEVDMLPELVERALNELRFKVIVRTLQGLKQELERLEANSAPDDELMDIMQQISAWNTVKRELSKILGERVVL